jgi:hypothetical protein
MPWVYRPMKSKSARTLARTKRWIFDHSSTIMELKVGAFVSVVLFIIATVCIYLL